MAIVCFSFCFLNTINNYLFCCSYLIDIGLFAVLTILSKERFHFFVQFRSWLFLQGRSAEPLASVEPAHLIS